MWITLLVVSGLLLLYRWYRFRPIMKDLAEKYVFITGCDSGFGNLLAKQLDKRGMKVLAACLTPTGAENLKKEASSRLQTTILNVTDPRSVSLVAKWVGNTVSDQGLWGLVNNAGVGIPTAPNEWLSKEDFQKMLDVNLLGMIDVTLKMLPWVRRAQGRVVNVASICGRLSFFGGGYCISKFGVEAFSDSLRREMFDFGVKVIVVEPGYFKTLITDPSILLDKHKKVWEKAPEEVRQTYGQAYFENNARTFAAGLLKASKNIHLVTDCMEHALTALHPMTRYSAGWDAKLFFLPISYCPTVLADYILRKLNK